jgi:hypothetical protein
VVHNHLPICACLPACTPLGPSCLSCPALQHKAGFTYTLDLGPVDSSPRRLQFETQNLSDIAWAYADRGLFPKPLFDVIAARWAGLVLLT